MIAEVGKDLDLMAFTDEWCHAMELENFTFTTTPPTWKYESSLLGLEVPMVKFLHYVGKPPDNVWEVVSKELIVKIQCLVNTVIESCLNSEGHVLTGFYCASSYILLCSVEGANIRNVYEASIFNKCLELLRISDKSINSEVLCSFYDALCKVARSALILDNHCQWLLIKSILYSMSNYHYLITNNVKKEIAAVLEDKLNFKFLVKELLEYIVSGQCLVGDVGKKSVINVYVALHENRKIKENFINFVCHACCRISERTDIRKQSESYILDMVNSFKDDDLSQFLRWILHDFMLSSKVVHRLFGIELCFQLCFNTVFKEDIDVIKKLLSAIYCKLMDKAPTIRTKAMIVLSDLIRSEERHLGSSVYLFLESQTEVKLDDIILSLSGDSKPAVRRGCCQIVSALLPKKNLNRSYLKLMLRFTLDTAVSVRKQGLQNVTSLLDSFPNTEAVQRLWLEVVLPLTADHENSIKTLAINCIGEMFLNLNDFYPILNLISNPHSVDLQSYFDFGVNMLLSTGFTFTKKTIEDLAVNLKSTETRTSALLIYKSISCRKPDCLPIPSFLEIIENLAENLSDYLYLELSFILECCTNFSLQGPVDTELLQKFKEFAFKQLQLFRHPILIIRLLFSLIGALQKVDISCGDQLSDLSSQIQSRLLNVCLDGTRNVEISSKQLNSLLFYLGELYQYSDINPDKNILLSIKDIIINQSEKSKFPTQARAQAVITLGKICLVDEFVARDSAVLFSSLLTADEKSSEVRNNAILVLSDFIVCYPTLVTEFIYTITDCLQDSDCSVRRQAILVLTRLLQEDYVKWRSGVVMKFLSNLVYENKDISSLCELCLTHVLIVRHPKTYFNFFVEFIFFANGLQNMTSITEANLTKFAFVGDDQRPKRQTIYIKMLKSLDDNQKLNVTARICKEVLSMFAVEDNSDIEDNMKPLLKDSLWLLSSPALKLKSLKSKISGDFDEDDSHLNMIKTHTKVVSNIVKQNFVENCTPILLAVRQRLKKVKSPLQEDLSRFISIFVKDFKDEIESLCGSDAQLIKEIEYEIACETREEEVSFTTSRLNLTKLNPIHSLKFQLNRSIGGFLNSPMFVPPTPYAKSSSVLSPLHVKRSNVDIATPLTKNNNIVPKRLDLKENVNTIQLPTTEVSKNRNLKKSNQKLNSRTKLALSLSPTTVPPQVSKDLIYACDLPTTELPGDAPQRPQHNAKGGNNSALSKDANFKEIPGNGYVSGDKDDDLKICSSNNASRYKAQNQVMIDERTVAHQSKLKGDKETSLPNTIREIDDKDDKNTSTKETVITVNKKGISHDMIQRLFQAVKKADTNIPPKQESSANNTPASQSRGDSPCNLPHHEDSAKVGINPSLHKEANSKVSSNDRCDPKTCSSISKLSIATPLEETPEEQVITDNPKLHSIPRNDSNELQSLHTSSPPSSDANDKINLRKGITNQMGNDKTAYKMIQQLFQNVKKPKTKATSTVDTSTGNQPLPGRSDRLSVITCSKNVEQSNVHLRSKTMLTPHRLLDPHAAVRRSPRNHQQKSLKKSKESNKIIGSTSSTPLRANNDKNSVLQEGVIKKASFNCVAELETSCEGEKIPKQLETSAKKSKNNDELNDDVNFKNTIGAKSDTNTSSNIAVKNKDAAAKRLIEILFQDTRKRKIPSGDQDAISVDEPSRKRFTPNKQSDISKRSDDKTPCARNDNLPINSGSNLRRSFRIQPQKVKSNIIQTIPGNDSHNCKAMSLPSTIKISKTGKPVHTNIMAQRFLQKFKGANDKLNLVPEAPLAYKLHQTAKKGQTRRSPCFKSREAPQQSTREHHHTGNNLNTETPVKVNFDAVVTSTPILRSKPSRSNCSTPVCIKRHKEPNFHMSPIFQAKTN